jgi:xanthine dehydrogenase accessory factor
MWTSLAEEREAVLITVADVEGHAYRREGAKLVRDETGVTGSVTAGCLSSQIRDLAKAVRTSGEPQLVKFDLRDDESWGLGLGCNGVIQLFAEPVDERFARLRDAHLAGDDGVGLVVVDAGASDEVAVGDRAYAPEGEVASVDGLPDWLMDAVSDSCRSLFERGRSATVTVTGPAGSEIRVLVDTVQAPPELYLFGSGTDINPVAELAKRAGFRVNVVSFRGGRADPERFPHADHVVATSATAASESLTDDADNYAIIMSHNAIDDRLCLASLLETSVQYIGLMGPDERFGEIRDTLASEGNPLTEQELERIYTPVGLDLGGGDPYQIAISIVSELLAVENDRNPGHLRERGSPIHDRSTVDDD